VGSAVVVAVVVAVSESKPFACDRLWFVHDVLRDFSSTQLTTIKSFNAMLTVWSLIVITSCLYVARQRQQRLDPIDPDPSILSVVSLPCGRWRKFEARPASSSA
jgi:hypothetical protein